MADWLPKANEIGIFGMVIIAGIAVILPMIFGTILGRIPKDFLFAWAVPLSTATLLLGFGIVMMEQYLEPLPKLIVSCVFGSIFVFGGTQITFLRLKGMESLPDKTKKHFRVIGAMFLVFGFLWIGISVYHFLKGY